MNLRRYSIVILTLWISISGGLTVWAQGEATPGVGGTAGAVAGAAASLPSQSSQPNNRCDTAVKAFVEADTEAVVELGAQKNNETAPPVNNATTKLKNSYVCTKLLEPMPFTVLSTGDFCVVSLWMTEGDGGREKQFLITKQGAADVNIPGRGNVPQSELSCTMIGVPSGLGAIERYIAIVYRWASMIMGIVCVILMVIGGILMTMEGANPDMKGTGIKLIKSAIIAMVLLFLSGGILAMINPVFFT